MEQTLKEFLEAKLTKMGFFNIGWKRKDDTIYVSYTNPDDNGARVTEPLAEVIDDLLWQESGV